MQSKDNSQKTIVIVHGWTGNANRDWMRWLGRELSARGFKVIVPDMPFSHAPIPFLWVSYLKRIVGTIDKNTFFVGHSIGCQAIMRFLADQNRECGGAIFVAGWFRIRNFSQARSELIPNTSFGTKLYNAAARAVIARWESPFDYANLKRALPKSVAFLSDNDRLVDEKINATMFQENAGSEIILIQGGGHFTAWEGFAKFPKLLNEILKMANAKW